MTLISLEINVLFECLC